MTNTKVNNWLDDDQQDEEIKHLDSDQIVAQDEDINPSNNISMDDCGKDGSGCQKPLVPIFLFVDTSSSMTEKNEYGGDTKMETVQKAIISIADQLVEYQHKNGVIMRVSVLCFDSNVTWLFKNADPSELLNITFNAQGLTHMGDAFKEAETMLHREKFNLVGASQYKRAVMILLTDGCDVGSSITPSEGVQILRKNNWFVTGTRIAFAVGVDADRAPLEEFTGCKETVIKTDRVNVLKLLLEKLTIKASVASSVGSNATLDEETRKAFDKKFADSTQNTKDLVEEVKDDIEIEGGDIDWFDDEA